MTTKILITCPPMLADLASFEGEFRSKGWQVTAPNVTQTLSVDELLKIVPKHHGWIIGDDPANKRVVQAGRNGILQAAVKWGVGVDNVDKKAFDVAEIPITNTPGMFGNEVADMALGYLIALARHTFTIHEHVKAGEWIKPQGSSLAGKTCGVVGYGDIGQQLTKRLIACGMSVIVYDPFTSAHLDDAATLESWPVQIDQCDFICFTCALNDSNRHMLNEQVMQNCKRGVKIINVARGPLIDEQALVAAQSQGIVTAVALDVFEEEPLPMHSGLRAYEQNLFGSHNSSNTAEGVRRTSLAAITLLSDFLSASYGK